MKTFKCSQKYDEWNFWIEISGGDKNEDDINWGDSSTSYLHYIHLLYRNSNAEGLAGNT